MAQLYSRPKAPVPAGVLPHVTKDFIHYLGKLGKLIYNDKIDKPFYRIIVRGKFTLKGSQGNMTSRVLLPENADDSWLKEISEYAEQYEDAAE